MAKTVTLAFGNASFAVANRALPFVVTVANTDAAAVLLKSLVVEEVSDMGTNIEQPTFLSPGQPWDTSQPTLAALTGSQSYGFSVMVASPNMPNVSATNPGGAAPDQAAMADNAQMTLRATAMTSDGSVFSATLTVPVLSAVYPFPVSDVGTALFRQGGNSNLVAVGVG